MPIAIVGGCYYFSSEEKADSMSDPRVAPLTAPYEPSLKATFDRIMPAGVPPLALFRTLARVPRVWEKFRAGSLLDKGPLSLRRREIVIDRICARTGNDYEWGVHVAFFAERASLDLAQVAALATGGFDATVWTDDERALIAAVDQLLETTRLDDATWAELVAAFDVDQIMEVMALVGFYRTVALFCNALRLKPEPYGAPLPARP